MNNSTTFRGQLRRRPVHEEKTEQRRQSTKTERVCFKFGSRQAFLFSHNGGQQSVSNQQCNENAKRSFWKQQCKLGSDSCFYLPSMFGKISINGGVS